MPGSLRVVPEYSANMMWNLKYSMMAGGVMMKVPDSTNLATPFTMTVTAEEAAKLAQDYLDAKTTGLLPTRTRKCSTVITQLTFLRMVNRWAC